MVYYLYLFILFMHRSYICIWAVYCCWDTTLNKKCLLHKANLIHWGAACSSTRPRRSMATAFVTKDVEAFNALASATRHELPEDLDTRLRCTKHGDKTWPSLSTWSTTQQRSEVQMVSYRSIGWKILASMHGFHMIHVFWQVWYVSTMCTATLMMMFHRAHLWCSLWSSCAGVEYQIW